jgi:ABC-2 type transport system permease protein
VISGVAAATYGLVPHVCAAVSWTALGLVVALSIFGRTLQLSHWVLDLSPFTHAPRLPGGAVAAAPLAWLSALAVVLAAGLAALRRRDTAGS